MARRKKTTKRSKPKAILRLPDLEESRNAVLKSLAAASSQESYAHAIEEFIGWYCSKPHLAFNRTVVLRYRFYLEQKNLAPSTMKLRVAALRRLAHEAAHTGLLGPELAAGIGRVKSAKRLGVRIGNWLTVDQSRTLLAELQADSLRGKRDRAILALLIGCGLRRSELVGLGMGDFQVREEHWVIGDLIGDPYRYCCTSRLKIALFGQCASPIMIFVCLVSATLIVRSGTHVKEVFSYLNQRIGM